MLSPPRLRAADDKHPQTQHGAHSPSPPVPGPLPPPSPPPSHSSHAPSPVAAATPSPPLSPLSYSAYNTVLHTLHSHFRSLPEQGANQHQEFSLPYPAFERLYQRYLDPDSRQPATEFDHWCAQKLRWDYDPEREKVVLRMPNAIHEVLIERVRGAIWQGKEELASELEKSHNERACAEVAHTDVSGGDASGNGSGSGSGSGSDKVEGCRLPVAAALTAELRNVDSTGSTNLRFTNESGAQPNRYEYSPDATFTHQDAPYPALVLEVAYSQSSKSLKNLAYDYIERSECHIACVVGIQLSYNEPSKGGALDSKRDQTANFSIWRSALDENGDGYCECVCDSVLFREADGTLLADAPPIELRVSDIIPSSILDDCCPPDHELRGALFATITPIQLGEFLERAEKHQKSRRRRPARQYGQAGQRRTRKRQRTPEEELSDDREGKYKRLEDAAWAREKQEDGTYTGRRTREAPDASTAEPTLQLRTSQRLKEKYREG
ncbi:uncharacterized protein MYCFIDRAFT_217091 [Pseudocercospora fijiensis CIRAD86]|uniref:Restriction endonuclease domain-containing protein n=1 Tax=Pseudocercospora fijiensis (strain CIRAD86) TaxID=383855 RepID=M2ZDI8_PSEFD|nr:uncharacterized protein MYCFIDRAFT_217091 [Pseudocercospora fijiensis CIRAD86]EME77164.1 hypothetical protein MYCFIDRAFT_217091 [Pseudocercospora fijiensis CIRAD86]